MCGDVLVSSHGGLNATSSDEATEDGIAALIGSKTCTNQPLPVQKLSREGTTPTLYKRCWVTGVRLFKLRNFALELYKLRHLALSL